MPVYLSITSSQQPFKDDKELNDKIVQARINFQLYSYEDEMSLFNQFVEAIEKADTNETTKTINKLIMLTRSRIRSELKLPVFTL